jgi:hypothetical protein
VGNHRLRMRTSLKGLSRTCRPCVPRPVAKLLDFLGSSDSDSDSDGDADESGRDGEACEA